MNKKRFEAVHNDKNAWDIIDYKESKKIDGLVIYNDLGSIYFSSAPQVSDLLNKLDNENKKLKSELKIYHKIAYCGNCQYHDYDWNINDDYGGDEYEICEKGNDVTEGICEEWKKL